jgi:hypothetical protein
MAALHDEPEHQARPDHAFDRVVALLKDVRPTSKAARARCTAHADPRPTLDCDLGDDGSIRPEPVIVSGRRLWSADQMRQAADALGLLTAEFQGTLDAEGGQ